MPVFSKAQRLNSRSSLKGMFMVRYSLYCRWRKMLVDASPVVLSFKEIETEKDKYRMVLFLCGI